MRVRLILAVLLAIPVLAAVQPCTCVSGRLTDASYGWDFPAEAASRIQQVSADTRGIRVSTDVLRTYGLKPEALSP